MPMDGATFYAMHERLSACPLHVGVEGHPSDEECPLRQMHTNPLHFVGSNRTFLACSPGSLVVARALIASVALTSTDSTIGGVLQWFALEDKHHLMDVALAESYGCVKWWPFKTITRKKKAKPKAKPKSRKGCICECSVHASHPPGAMALPYGHIPCIYRRILRVWGRIIRVYGRILRVYGRILVHPFTVYGLRCTLCELHF